MRASKVLIALALFLSPVLARAATTAVVIVDMQPDFLPADPTSEDYKKAETLIERQVELLKWARGRHYKVLVFEYDRPGTTDAKIRAAVEEFGHGQFAFVTKYSDGGFDSAEYKNPARKLNEWGVQDLIITGINGSACVLCTVKGALEKNFNVFTSPELVATFGLKSSSYPDQSWSFSLKEHLQRFHSKECLDALKRKPAT